MKPTTYQMRRLDTGELVRSGTLGNTGGETLDEAAARLVAGLDVTVDPSGAPRFLIAHGAPPVAVYLRVDPAQTEKGRNALGLWRDEQRKRQEDEARKQSELDALLAGLSTDEAIARLRGAE